MQLRHPDPVDERLSVLSSLINSSIPRDALLECGGFDEEILAAEDYELGIRLYKNGCIFRFLPAAEVHEHYVKTSQQHLSGAARALGAGDLRISRKHPEFRIHSSLSGLAESSSIKRFILNTLIKSRVSIVPLLSFPLRWERWMIPVPPLRKFGLRLLALSERLVRLRSAAKAAGSWSQLRQEFILHCPALLYHHVGPKRPDMYVSLNVSAKKFEQQIRWLVSRGYQGISPSDWLHWLREGKELPPKPILITFDDAYADTAEYALPVLQRYGFPAAVYVVSARVAATNTWDESQGSGTLRLMTAEQIQHWADNGIEFGGHSRTHADLVTLTPSECKTEIDGSRLDLEALLGQAPESFAYPFGHFNEVAYAQASSAFGLAFSTIEGMNYLRTDRHLLRRIYVGPSHSLLEFAFNVYRGRSVQPLNDLRIKLALRTRLKRALHSISRKTKTD
jgi:peptidoglycan/xylan/chitin deacetylase (PgdA/CDA1 family)